jgi:hypothetical protein
MKDSFLRPIRFIWNHSSLLAPARRVSENGGDWTDAACAAGYVVLLFFLLYGLALSLSGWFLLGTAAVAVAMILVRLAIRRFF